MLLIAGPENYYVRLRDEPGKKLDQRLCPGCGGDHLAIGNAIPERCSSQQSLLFSARRQARPDTRRQFGNREGNRIDAGRKIDPRLRRARMRFARHVQIAAM